MIEVKNISKSFGNVIAINKVSFKVSEQDSLVIFGPSGCGKTTLLRLIAGLELPDEGYIYINGEMASKPGWTLAPHKRGLGFVFQTPTLWPHMTVTQNILFGLQDIPKNEAQSRLNKLVEQTALTGMERRYPHQISIGEARRAALARSLAPQPKYLLMDEPLTNVDLELKEKLLSLIKEAVLQTKASMVYVTHDAEEAAQISEDFLYLRKGRLEANDK